MSIETQPFSSEGYKTLQILERPESSLLDHDESKPLSTKQMAHELAGTMAEEDMSKNRAYRVASWQVAQAIKHGYVIPQWRVIDYIRSTWKGMEGDPVSPLCVCGTYIGKSEEAWAHHLSLNLPGEHDRKPRKRFHLINIWGEQGATKSSLAAQWLGLAHGGYNNTLPENEWKEVWDWCQTVTITNRQDLENVGAGLDKPGARFDILYFDDLNSIIPRQLAWEDRDLYRHTFELLGMVRRATGTILTSEPNIELVMDAFNRVMTIEVIVYPNSTYKAERMCHDIHPYLWAKDRVTKIVLEEEPFNPYDTPFYYWKEYENRTNAVGHGAFQKVIQRMRELEEGENKQDKEVQKGVNKAFRIPVRDITDEARKQGMKLSERDAERLLRIYKDKVKGRIGEIADD